jgi:hypothetical protein
MNRRSKYTLQQLLDEVKQTIPSFQEGQIFETIKSIYPNIKISRNKRNINYKNISFTKPLASSRKAKENFLKEDSPLRDFYKNFSKGDFLLVIETNGKIAKCVNLSLKENIKENFYNNEEDYIFLDYTMIANGTVKLFKRKNIDKYFID